MKASVISACPVCERTLETTVDKAKAGLKCPHCATGFVPDQVDVKLEAEAFTPQPNLTETERRRSTARTFIWVGLFCVALAGLCAFSGWRDVVESRDAGGSFQTAAGFLIGAFMLGVIGQLIHVRAALEERNGRR